MTTTRRHGVVLLAGAMVAMLAGLWGALALLGFEVPASTTTASDHGILMALGFLGTMIAVERAVALGRLWGWGAPAASAVGTVWLLVGDSSAAGKLLLVVAGLILLAIYVVLHQVQPSLHNALMALGTTGWIIGAALWLAGWNIYRILPWLAGFLVVTIAAERLELSRLIGVSRRARRVLAGAIILFMVGAAISVWSPGPGVRVCGVALLALAGWLATCDAARRTVRARGVTRFIAVGLLAGYVWLAVGGVAWLLGGFQIWGSTFDTQVHAVFLGFVVSMIFAHAPVIAPAVLRRPMSYWPVFYVHLALLHVSLLVRLLGGDLFGSRAAWQIGGLLNEVAMLNFVVVTVASVLTARRRRSSGARG
ncbi:MAG TPA: hypothetical protein VIS06_06620, partial [Mycobacteriales bacterium]